MRQPTRILLAALGLATMTASPADEGKLNPSRYVYLETSAREISIEGMEKRLAIRRNDGDEAKLRRISKRTRERIRELFAEWEVEPGDHATYGGRNREAIEAWLADHPDWQRNYEQLMRRAKTLSNKLENTR